MVVEHHDVQSGFFSGLEADRSLQSIDEHRQLVVVLLEQEVGYFAVDYQRVPVELVLHLLDHLKVLGFGDLLLHSRGRVQGQVVGEGDDGSLAGDSQLPETQTLQRQHHPMLLYEPVDQLEVPHFHIFCFVD